MQATNTGYILTIKDAVIHLKGEYYKKYGRVPVETGNVIHAIAKFVDKPPGLIAVELVDEQHTNPLQVVEPAYFWVILRKDDYGGWARDSKLSTGHQDSSSYVPGITFDRKIYDSMFARGIFTYLVIVKREGHINKIRRQDIETYVQKYDTIQPNTRIANQWEVGIPNRLGGPL